MKIRISADSTCDLSPELAEQYGVFLAPLCFVINDKMYYEHVDITPDDIFDIIENKRGAIKTAALNPAEYKELFEKQLALGYDALIHVDISSAFSSCYSNACQAAAELENVFVVDSKNLCTGFGLVVLEAARLAAEGEMPPEQICERLRSFVTNHVDASFVLDTLDYMRRGGRCSGVAAFGANLLRLKPCIEVVNGVMTVGKKYRGQLPRVLPDYVDDRLSDPSHVNTELLFVTHTGCSDELVSSVLAHVAEHIAFKKVLVTRAGCSVSIHCGPGTLGILFKTL